MKILLFNLGTIEHRILNWEVDGFRSLFEQDIILWGPVPDPYFEFNGKAIPILRIFEETSVEKLFDQLPEGWYPDIVVCDTSSISYVPDIYLCPVKTLIFTRDSWSDTVYNRGLVEFFDFLNSSTVDRNAYRKYRVNILPLRGFAVSTPGLGTLNAKYDTRRIDVVAIANYDNSFYHERHRIFYRLAETSGSRYDIRFLRSIRRSEINNYYQRSKIVIDWAHTLSNRSYEAALNGCLLFSHENNKAMSDFWTPWEEYVPYNEDNLSSLITRYLENPELSKRIAENASRKVSQVPATWGEMVWDRVSLVNETELNISERIKHNESLSPSKLYHRTASPLLYNYDYGKAFPQNWKELYFERMDKAISSAINSEEKIQLLIDVSRLAFLLGMHDKALVNLEHLREVIPDYAWIYYLKARIAFSEEDFDYSLSLLEHGLECIKKAPDMLMRYVMPVIEKGNTCDGRRITDYMWQSVYGHDNDYQVKTLAYMFYELYGYIHQLRGEKSKAIASYISACEIIPIPDCMHRVYPLLIDSDEYFKLANVAERGIEDSPYDSVSVLYRAYGLIRTRRKKTAAISLIKHSNALKCFKGIRQIKLIRLAILGLVPVLFISRGISLLVINKLSDRILSTSVRTYLG